MFHILSIGIVDSSKGRGANSVDVTTEDGVATMVYTPLPGELCKKPIADDLTHAIDGPYAVGSTLTFTLTGHVNGPYEESDAEYEIFQLDDLQGGTLTEIVATTTTNTYTLDASDSGFYIVARGRFVQDGGANNKSDWFYSEATPIITGAGSGDITFTWEDHFDFESGASAPANANTPGEDVSYINLGTHVDAENWTGSSLSKPTWDGTALVFTKANSHRMLKPTSVTHPPKFETWAIIQFTETSGQAFSFGSNNLIGLNTSSQYTGQGMTAQAGGDVTDYHVIRIVRNGASSIFQVDGGTEVTFTDSSSSASFLIWGTTYTGGAPCSFKLKKFWRTPYNTFLTNVQRDDRWTYLGYP